MLSLPSVSLSLCLCFGGVTCCRRGGGGGMDSHRGVL